jgi:glutathione S-transferase
MLKLYYSPGACSLSPHIALHETGLAHELVKVDLKSHTLVDGGASYYDINPKGSVPLLEMEDGRRLTEGPAIVQFLADQAPESLLAPANGTYERYKLQEWLNYITSEVHKSFGPIFQGTNELAVQGAKDKLAKAYAYVNQRLDEGEADFLTGDTFTVADGYLFVTLRWAMAKGINLDGLDTLKEYFERVKAREGVQAALKMEGIA